MSPAWWPGSVAGTMTERRVGWGELLVALPGSQVDGGRSLQAFELAQPLARP